MNWVYERLSGLQFGWRDGVDIVMVAVIIYAFLRLLRGTRGMQMVIGIVALTGAYFAARWLDLTALERLFREVLFYAPFALIVLFQQEVRSGLSSVARSRPLRMLRPRGVAVDIGMLTEAVEDIARRRWGALIGVERTQSLDAYVETGKRIDADMSIELLVNIFTPGSPLHDGAVIVRNDRIAAAAVLLPLTSNTEAVTKRGTRHRAALGMSEETDAIVIVISEENQSIGVAVEGKMQEQLTGVTLGQILERELGVRGSAE
ncbi:MAG TPA: diadenylate cyclase CdaA [Thermoanaerobaculia bacterium]|nr:diadenylate cyclase CdaA [Thermoanaerobaculia bacterium]